MKKRFTGVYYNTAAVIDAMASISASIARTTFPHVNPGFWEKFIQAWQSRIPGFDTAFARIGVYICTIGIVQKARAR